MKKTASLIISAILAATAAPAVSASAASITVPEVTAVTGDINSDGSIAVSDAVLIMEYLLGKEEFTETQYKAADLNTDGNVDTFDFVVMREKIVAEIESDIKENGISYRNDTTSMILYKGCKKIIKGLDAVISSTDELKTTFDGVFRPFIVTVLCDIYDENYFKDNVLFIDAELWDDCCAVPDGTDISEENGVITITKHRKSLDDSDDTDGTMIQAFLHQVSYPKEKYTGQNVVWREEGAKRLNYSFTRTTQNNNCYGYISSFDELKTRIGQSTDYTDEELTEEALRTLSILPEFRGKATEESAETVFEGKAILFKGVGSQTFYDFISNNIDASNVVLRGNKFCFDYLLDPYSMKGDIVDDRLVQVTDIFVFNKKELEGFDLTDLEYDYIQCYPETEQMLVMKDGPGKAAYSGNTVYVYKSDFAGRSFISIDAAYVQFMSPCFNYRYIDDIEIDPKFAEYLGRNRITVEQYAYPKNEFEISFPINSQLAMYSNTYPLPGYGHSDDPE